MLNLEAFQTETIQISWTSPQPFPNGQKMTVFRWCAQGRDLEKQTQSESAYFFWSKKWRRRFLIFDRNYLQASGIWNCLESAFFFISLESGGLWGLYFFLTRFANGDSKIEKRLMHWDIWSSSNYSVVYVLIAQPLKWNLSGCKQLAFQHPTVIQKKPSLFLSKGHWIACLCPPFVDELWT